MWYESIAEIKKDFENNYDNETQGGRHTNRRCDYPSYQIYQTDFVAGDFLNLESF